MLRPLTGLLFSMVSEGWKRSRENAKLSVISSRCERNGRRFVPPTQLPVWSHSPRSHSPRGVNTTTRRSLQVFCWNILQNPLRICACTDLSHITNETWVILGTYLGGEGILFSGVSLLILSLLSLLFIFAAGQFDAADASVASDGS